MVAQKPARALYWHGTAARARRTTLKQRGVFTTTHSRKRTYAIDREAAREVDFYRDALRPNLEA